MLAWEVLRAVDERGAYANILLPGLLARRRLAVRDRAFATELAYGSLRAQGLLDSLLDTVASRPMAAVDPPVRDALRLGAYQLVFTRVPPRAAVASTVDLVRATGGERPVRFANAVLRRLASRVADTGADTGVGADTGAGTGADLAALLDAPPFAQDPLGHLAAVTAHPRWIVDAFADALGGDAAQTRIALEADDARPLVHLVAYPGRIGAAELAGQAREAGLSAAPAPYSPYGVRLDGGDPGALPAVRAGLAGVQDEGSQLVVLAAARAVRAARAGRLAGAAGSVVVDLCAGPGGKAALLAALLPDLLPGARLLAVEPRLARARMVARGLAGAPSAVVACADGLRPPLGPARADLVLVDAPCTGLGALRRRPEARWRKSPADVTALARLQRQLVACALDLVRLGGVVAYATCSPHPAETADVVTAVAGARDGVSILDARAHLPEVGGLGAGPFVQLWPHLHGTDAMFLALLRRTPGA